MHKIMISVGEASGDLNGANLAKALKTLEPDCRLLGMGGEAMRTAGVDIVYDIADLGVMGFVEIIKSLPRMFKLKNRLLQIMAVERPDVLVVIDYPEFNMRLAKAAKEIGIPVVSYISPSAWAWRRGRAKDVAKIVERVAAIFPFEADVYNEAGANVTFVGHPLLDIVKPALSKQEAYEYFEADAARPVVMLMPGSRMQEIDKLLPVMLAAAEKIVAKVPDCQFYLPVASTISREIIQSICHRFKIDVKLTQDHTYDLMNIANMAVAASGTATLETALLNLPTVIIYKLAPLTYFLGKLLVKIPNYGLPNIVAGRRVVPELIQGDANPERIAAETLEILTNKELYQTIKSDLAAVKTKLGNAGAVEKAARVVLEVADQFNNK